ncbi:MAG TPA: hypothetical protein VJU61_12215 [Polyangiaceae bacterium]|nr:hypothetical protein [Polyangiaceae bacterium]
MRLACRLSRVVSRTLVLFGAVPVGGGCRGDDAPPGYAETRAHQALSVTRELNGPAPVVRAELELSPFALEHFMDLWIDVQIESGQALEQQAVLARWLGDAALPGAQADFAGGLSNSARLRFWLTSSPCGAAPCLFTLELSPGGEWTSDVPFPVEYEVVAWLALGDTGARGALDADLGMGLQVAP